MKTKTYKYLLRNSLFIIVLSMSVMNINAQRLPHRSSNSGVRQANKPTTRPAGNNQSSRPVNTGKPNRQNNNKNININSNNKTSNIVVVRPNNSGSRPSNNANRPGNNVTRPNNNGGRPNNSGGHPANNKPVAPSNRPPGNRPNPTPPHHSYGPGPRPVPVRYPPYVWGGIHIYYGNPYYYFPFRPYRWYGWYPWGHVITTMVSTAIIVSVINDSGDKEDYNYDNGNFYLKTEDGYMTVTPPIGAVIPSMPSEAEKVKNGDDVYYYYGASFYQRTPAGYEVVIPTAGTVVTHLPEGAEEVKVGDKTYVMVGEMYFQPIQVDNKNMYEIVEFVEE